MSDGICIWFLDGRFLAKTPSSAKNKKSSQLNIGRKKKNNARDRIIDLVEEMEKAKTAAGNTDYSACFLLLGPDNAVAKNPRDRLQ